MANDLEICNLALSRVRANAIQALTEATREAQVCRRHLPVCREAVLRDYDWAFARRTATLAELSTTDPVWSYVYALPADCLAPRRIFSSVDPKGSNPQQRIPFERKMHPTQEVGVLCTDQDGAQLVYTAKIANATLFDAIFVDALAWRLASEFAYALRANLQLMTSLYNVYARTLGSGSAESANESYTAPAGSGDIVASRA